MKNYMLRSLFISFVTALIILLSFSCSKHLVKSDSIDDLVIYPPPPDTVRIQYLTSISNSKDITGSRSAFGKFIYGDFEEMPIQKPYGICISRGKIYICDTGIDALEVIDLQAKKFEYFNPGGRGQLMKPVNCYVDDRGFLYVADGGRKQIVIFDPKGKYVNNIGGGEKFKPTDVFVTLHKIWVANYEDHSVNVYDRESLNLLYSLPSAEEGEPGYLFSPSNIFVTEKEVYVSDFGDFSIKIYKHDGEFIRSVGSYGNNLGQFSRPKGVAVDWKSNMYVVDAGFENTQIFNDEGKVLMFFGGPYKKSGDMYLPAKVAIDYDNIVYFKDLVDEAFKLKYLIFVTNQYGPDKINVYGYVEEKKSIK